MRKLYCLFLALFILCTTSVFSQTNIASYGFASSTGTYTPISGGTVVASGSYDNTVSAAVPLGGSFTFGGASFTTCYISTNGFITFGAAPSTSSYTPLSTLGTTTGAISAFGQDAGSSTVTGATPEISYLNIGGTTGEFVVQFKDHANYYNRTVERLNFQIRLNLATGQINIVYGSWTNPGSVSTTGTTVHVGIRGNSTDWATNVNNLTTVDVPSGTTCSWANAVTGNANSSTMLFSGVNTAIKPSDGLTYTWTPQTGILPVRTFSAVSAITSNGATLAWTAPTGATQYNVQYRTVGSCTWTNFSGNPVSATTATLTGLNPSTTYQVRVQASNGTINSIWSHIPNQAGTGNGYVAAGTFTTTGIATDLQALQLVSPTSNIISCYTANPVTIRLKNVGTASIDFTTNNATVSASVTGPNAMTFTPVIINTGTLAANATLDVVISSSYNMSAAGTYTFNASVVLATPDANTSNNAISPVSFTASAPASLPQLVNFSGYSGTPASLNAAFPGWTEGSGAVTPTINGDGSFLNTSSTDQLTKYGPAAKMNLYNTNNGWIISPKFVPTASHEFRYKATLVNYGTATATNFGVNDTVRAMISTNCGLTWTTLREFSQATNQGLDNSTNDLRPFIEPLSAYAGQTVMVAIYARRTPTATTPDIDILIDDLAIDVAQSCFSPSGLVFSSITTTSASLDWTPPATAPASYDVYISTSSTAPTSSTTPTATGVTNPYAISGLTANTLYYVWVRGNCGSSSTSNWSDVASFRTLCDPFATPTASAETFATFLPSACWSQASGTLSSSTTFTSATSNWIQDDFGNVTTPVNKAAKVNIYGTTGDEWLISPTYNLGTTANKQLEFDLALTTFGATSSNTLGSDDKFAVLISTDNGATWSDANILRSWNSSTAISNTGEHIVIDLSAYTGLVKFAFYGESTVSNADNDLFVDNFAINVIPICAAPSSLVASGLTNNSVTIDWTPPANAPASYDVYYSTTNTPPNAGTTPSVTAITNPYNLTGLNASTTYYIWVRGNCGSGVVSTWTTLPLTITTQCNPATIINENFDIVSTPALPTCWGKIIRGATVSSFATVGTSTTSAHTSPNAVEFYNSSSGASDDIILVSPVLSNLSAGTHQLKFWARASSATNDLEIGTLDNSSGTAVFTVFSTVDLTTTYQQFTVSFNGYSGTDQHIGFRRLNASTYTYVYVDDVVWEPIPSCLEPTALVVSSITTNSASLDWTPPATAPASYDVYISTSSTAPTGSTTPTATGVTNPYALTSLTASTTYYVWVRGNCGAGDVSVWSQVKSFTTLCSAVTTFTQNFDGVTTPAFPTCWYKLGTGGSASTQSTDANSSPNTLYLYSSSTSSIGMVTMPPVSNLAAGTHRLKFNMRANFTVGGVVEVGYLTDPSDPSTFNLIQSVTASSLTYQPYSIVPGSIGGTAEVLAFRHTGSPANSVLIDDVIWETIPSCLEPSALVVSSITTNSASLDWTPPATAPASYDVYISTSSTAPTGSTTPTATGVTNPYALTSLTASTTYYVWVRGNCGTGNVSVWSQMKSFTTACNAVNVPYVENFDGVTPPALPNCVSVENVNADAYTWTTLAAPTGYTGNVLYIRYNGSAAMNDWFYTSGLNLTAGKSYVLSYKYGNNSTSYIEKMKIYLGTSASSSAMTTELIDYPQINDNTPHSHAIRFTAPTTGVYYLGFYGYSATNQYNLYLDDISVTEANVAPTTANSCVTVSAPSIDGQNNNKWMALTDASGNIVGEINGNGNNLGNVTVKVYRNSGAVRQDLAGKYYLDRNIEITPATQPTTPVSVRLYFTAAEFTALKNQSGSNVNTYTDISVFKNADACGSQVRAVANKLTTVTATYEGQYVANFDVSSFSSFYFAASTYSILPANLLTFSGSRQGGANNLKWTVAQEIDVQAYEVERSEDGRTWSTIGIVNSLGNTTAQRNYGFTDNNISGVKQYYRLHIIDRNGNVRLSNVVVITGIRPTTLVLSGLFPNPTSSKINLLVDAPAKDNITIVVMDAVGRIVKSQQASVDAGSNTLSMDVTGLSQGSYLVKLTCQSNCESATTKFVKE